MISLSFTDEKQFSLTRDSESDQSITLPSAGIVLRITDNDCQLMSNEAKRFLKETIAHSTYPLRRFKILHSFLSSQIESLSQENIWHDDGFCSKALNTKGSNFTFEAENILTNITLGHSFSKHLKEILGKMTHNSDPNKALPEWPSIDALNALPQVQESEYKGQSTSPFYITSSSTLAGFVKPIIFCDGTMDIALNGRSVKVYIKKDDPTSLLTSLLNEQEIELFNTAKRGWEAISLLSDAVECFIQKITTHGYDRDFDYFNEEGFDLDGIHRALLTLKKSLESEDAARLHINQNK